MRAGSWLQGNQPSHGGESTPLYAESFVLDSLGNIHGMVHLSRGRAAVSDVGSPFLQEMVRVPFLEGKAL